MALLEINDLCYSYTDGDSRKVIYNGASVDFDRNGYMLSRVNQDQERLRFYI